MKVKKNALMMSSTIGIAIGMLSLGLPMVSAQQEKQPSKEKAAEVTGDPYTLNVCIVSGEELGDDAITKEIDGREARFCCDGCVAKFEKDPDKYWEKVDAMIVAQQLPWYPEMGCAVSGEKLGGMGEPINYVYKNRLVRFCCGGCVKSFEKDPATYLAKVDEQVIAQQVANYPLEKCIISGGALDGMGGPLDQVYANRLVRYCCGGCIKSFKKDPVKYFATIDEAYGEHSPAKSAHEGSEGEHHEKGGEHKEKKGEHGG